MSEVKASVEVRRLIGPEILRKVSTAAYASYICAECHEAGRTTVPTNVVVYLYRGYHAAVRLAHANCRESEIIEADGDPPAEIDPDRSRGDMRAMTLVLEYPDEPARRPVLLLEPRTETVRPTHGEDRITMPMAGLLERGLGLITSGGQPPDLAEDWRLHRPDRHHARLVEGRDSVVYDGECAQPEDWVQLVDSVGACVVLIGTTIGLYSTPGDELSGDRIRGMLDEAASAGQLAGGLVIGAGSYVSSLSQVQQLDELHRRIARFWRRHD
jgi:hypothetical protein